MFRSKILDVVLLFLTVVGVMIIASNIVPGWLGVEVPIMNGVALVFLGAAATFINARQTRQK